MKKLKEILFFLFTVLWVVSCRMGSSSENETMPVRVKRLDKLLYEYVTYDKFSAFQHMKTDDIRETRILVEDVLDLGSMANGDIGRKIKDYYSDTLLTRLMADALKKYENMEPVEKQLTTAFRHLHTLIPSVEIPAFYAQISALSQSIVVKDDLVGFSIDKYMGRDYPLYKYYFYDYQTRYMSPEYIVPDCLMFYLMSIYPFPWEKRYMLLDHMIYLGKIHWAVAHILGQKSMAGNLGYNEKECKWCDANEKALWRFMKDERYLIYSPDPKIIKGFTREADYTIFCGEDSPASLGVWVGARIVEAYMKNNKELTVEDLLKEENYQLILFESKYGE